MSTGYTQWQIGNTQLSTVYAQSYPHIHSSSTGALYPQVIHSPKCRRCGGNITHDQVNFWLGILGRWGYNTYMDTQKTPRKKRVDRNHIIYELVVNGKNYIGVTAKTESTVLKSVRARAAKHFYRAKTEDKNWLLCAELRQLSDKSEIEIRVHEVVRGKAAAHKREVEIRRAVRPCLNTDVRGD